MAELKRALITGGAGFVGSHLAEALLAAGCEVHVLDDLSTGSVENLEPYRRHPRFHYVIDSVRSDAVTAELVDRCDVVFHLAAAVGVALIVDEPVRTIETNVSGTEVVLRHASKKRKLVLVASTSEVYGKSTAVPFREDADLVLGPTSKHRWAYACSKALDEFLALAHWRERKQPVAIVRLFNTVGPRQSGRYGMVVPRFVQQALSGEPITVYGDGRQSRCFTYVGDVVRGLVALASEPRAVGQVVNLGNPEEITIGDLALRVREIAGSASPIVHVAYDEAYDEGFEDMPRRVPDIGKARELIGFEPRVKLDEMLRLVVLHERRAAAAWKKLTRPPRRSRGATTIADVLPGAALAASGRSRRRALAR